MQNDLNKNPRFKVFDEEEIEFMINEDVKDVRKLVKEKVAEYGALNTFRALFRISEDHPAVFVKAVLNHPLFSYQVQFIESLPQHRRILINAGRQVGKSTVVSLAILWMLIVKNRQIREVGKVRVKEPAIYISVAPSYSQAQIIFGKITNILFERYEFYKLFIKKIKRSSSREEIISVFDSRYISRSVKGKAGSDVLRGFTASGIVVDEAAFIPDLEDIYRNIFEPMTSTTNGWVIFISSPNRQDDFFYQIFKGKIPNWKVFHWTTDMNPLAKDFFEQMKAELGPDHPVFLREYLAKPAKAADQIFSDEAILKAMRGRYAKRIEDYDAFGFGLDLGVSHDHSVLSVVGYYKEKKVIELIKLVKFPSMTPWDEVVNTSLHEIEPFITLEKPSFGYFDATVFGKQVEKLFPNLTFYFAPFKFTSQSRMELIALLKSVVESEKLIIDPFEGQELVREMKNMRFRITHTGNIRPDHPKYEHDDCVMATAMAIKALFETGVPDPLNIKPLPPKELIETNN